jgi:hypothetical protein
MLRLNTEHKWAGTNIIQTDINNRHELEAHMSDVVVSYKGNNGEFFLREDSIEIRRRSVLGNLDVAMGFTNATGIASERIIPLEDIESVEYKPATMWMNGYLSLAVRGELRNNNGLRGAGKNPSSLVFFPSSNASVKTFVDQLNLRLKQKRATPMPVKNVSNEQSLSIADEIVKLKSLRDSGVISDEEFTAAKQRLLSR